MSHARNSANSIDWQETMTSHRAPVTPVSSLNHCEELTWRSRLKRKCHCMHFTPQLVEHMVILSVRHSSAVPSLCTSCWSQAAHLPETAPVWEWDLSSRRVRSTQRKSASARWAGGQAQPVGRLPRAASVFVGISSPHWGFSGYIRLLNSIKWETFKGVVRWQIPCWGHKQEVITCDSFSRCRPPLVHSSIYVPSHSVRQCSAVLSPPPHFR